MTIRTESRLEVGGSIDDAWAYLCDVRRWSEWAPTVLECWLRDDGAFRPGAWVEQRAKDFGWNHRRSELVTETYPPHSMAFAGTMGSSVARWGMVFEEMSDAQTEAMMWVEIDVANVMRAIPGRSLEHRVQRVSDIEMAAIKAAIESGKRAGATSP